MTKTEAMEKWSGQFKPLQTAIIEELWANAENRAGWREVTKPCLGDKVWFTPDAVAQSFPGTITGTDEQGRYEITLDEPIDIFHHIGDIFYAAENAPPENSFQVVRDSVLPKWETMWSFGDLRDKAWLEKDGNLQRMSDCGFRIYKHKEFGYFFGMDGGDYDLYERHWIPLYEARGLEWHDKEAEKPVSEYKLQAYIENPNRPHDGGFTMPLPAAKEVFAPFLDNLGIKDMHDVKVGEVYAAHEDDNNLSYWLNRALRDMTAPKSLEELNYLAAKIVNMTEEQREIFGAALQAKWSCDTLGQMIVLSDNLDCFYLQPAYSSEMYGEFLITMAQDDPNGCFERLENSKNPDDRDFANYIRRLEACVDHAAYARMIAKEEGGAFTDYGYLLQDAEMKTTYRGVRDIPAGHRISEVEKAAAAPEKQPVKVKVRPSLKETLERNRQKSRERFGEPTPGQSRDRGGETR